MKKIIIIITTITLLVGCSNNTEKQPVQDDNKTEVTQTDKNIQEETKIEEEPITVGMYIYENGRRTLLDNYETIFELNKDMLSTEVYNCNDQELAIGKQKEIWHKYYDTYASANPKIAYHIKFTTTDQGQIEKTIYSPNDTTDIYDYVQIYLYDDINQKDNSIYSHILEEEINNNTILTSIKLTGSTKTNQINSNIELSAFMYTSNNIDIDDTNNKYTINIIRK